MEPKQESDATGEIRKGTVMLLLTVLVEGTTTVSETAQYALLEVNNRLVTAITEVVGKVSGQIGWVKTDLTQLDDPRVNAGHCAVCGYWVTDRDQPDPLVGLPNGATVDGRLLCERHLPPEHPWSL
jgi:hypothetical protein